MPHRCTNCSETFPDGSKEMLSGCPRCGGNTFQYLPEGATEEPPAESPPERPDPPGADAGVTGTVGRAATTVRDYVSKHRTDPAPSDDRASTDESGGGEPAEQPAPAANSGDGSPQAGEAAKASDSQHVDQSADGGEAADTTGAGGIDRIPEGDAGEFSFGTDADDAEVSTEARSTEDTAQASARGEIADPSELPREEATGGDARPPRHDGRVVKEPDRSDRPDLETLREELNDQFESIRILEPGQYELNLMELYDGEEHIIALQEDGKYVIEVPESWRDEREDPDAE
jgi:hypothetical protein